MLLRVFVFLLLSFVSANLIETVHDVEASKDFIKSFNMTDDIPEASLCAKLTAHVNVVLWSEIKADLWSLIRKCALKGQTKCPIAVLQHASTRVVDHLLEKNYKVRYTQLKSEAWDSNGVPIVESEKVHLIVSWA